MDDVFGAPGRPVPASQCRTRAAGMTKSISDAPIGNRVTITPGSRFRSPRSSNQIEDAATPPALCDTVPSARFFVVIRFLVCAAG